VKLPFVPPECEQAYHMFYLVLPSLGYRDALIAHLKARGILSVFHYVPLHLSEMGRAFGAQPGHCPVTEDFSSRLLRLPFYNDLTEEEQVRVVTGVKALCLQSKTGNGRMTQKWTRAR
jgi:dTDP-4-amino-4,6-dideoxygalactose transaminase